MTNYLFIVMSIVLFSLSLESSAVTIVDVPPEFPIATPQIMCGAYSELQSKNKLASEIFARLAFTISKTQSDFSLARQYQSAGRCSNSEAYEDERYYFVQSKHQKVVWGRIYLDTILEE